MENNTLANIWQKSKLLVKGLIIGILILLLMIPSFFVKEIIIEREQTQRQAQEEVSSKWAGKQRISGPVLVVPFNEKVVATNGTISHSRQVAYFLPDKMSIQSKVNPVKKHRGIYQVMLYTADINMEGSFLPLPLNAINVNSADMLWKEAYICLGVSDSRGLKEQATMNWNGTQIALAPQVVNNAVFKEALVSPIAISDIDTSTKINFSASMQINGAEQLLFTPVGKETAVSMLSTWKNPSFVGSQLPITEPKDADSGFVANWKSFSYTRSFPQQWKNDAYNLETASFGTDLFIPVNGYQKTLRSVKYAILCIILTFTAFFLIETTNKKNVHPVQYALIGFALILFYTLLLSFSEYVGFNWAYCIAAVATVGLISWFVKGLLGSTRLSMLLSIVLLLLYSYVFSILQLQDYALLLGSVGLFLSLAVVMHFSKKIKW